MASSTKKPRGRFWSRLHFLIRCLGLTGLFACGAGFLLAYADNALPAVDLSFWREPLTSWDQAWRQVERTGGVAQEQVWPVLREPPAWEPSPKVIAWWLIVVGGGAALVALLLEFLVGLFFVAGRRSIFGISSAVQVGLATVLLVGINVYSYQNFARWDWTRDRQFTLPAELKEQLSQLRGETTIVVYQMHKAFGRLSDKESAQEKRYEFAAERKVVEKVKDLVEQFRELGPQFQVVVLDVEEEGYDDKLKALTGQSATLRSAIDSAQESTIFFHSRGRDTVQRLSFSEFYQLDKTESQATGNLVLLYQGPGPFARKVLNIDEKKPKVGVLVIHEVLTTEGTRDIGLAGVKKALTARGFEVQDVILKKWTDVAIEPAAYTYDESKYERLEEEQASLDADIKGMDEGLADLNKARDRWRTADLKDLTKEYARQLGGRQITEPMRARQLEFMNQQAALLEVLLRENRNERAEVAKAKSGLNVENVAELRRMSDVKAKLERTLTECDMLFIPRITLINVVSGERIRSGLYTLEGAQVQAIRDFLKAGKPVFACLGPINDSMTDRPDTFAPPGPDGVEELFGQLGIKLSKQTILYNVESKGFAERRSGVLSSSANVEVPAAEFDWKPEALPTFGKDRPEGLKPNPLRESMRILSRSVGKDQALDLRLRHPRPLYYEPPQGKAPAFEPEFMVASAASWNEENPFPTRERVPRFEPTKADDPSRGTIDEKRRGPFPIGVAVETEVPAAWYDAKDAKPATVRVAAIGHGHLFTGAELSPARERLFLDGCNWLLGRDDLLPQADRAWQYPRAELSDRDKTLWHWGTRLGLPGLFAWLGVVVLLARRLR